MNIIFKVTRVFGKKTRVSVFGINNKNTMTGYNVGGGRFGWPMMGGQRRKKNEKIILSEEKCLALGPRIRLYEGSF